MREVRLRVAWLTDEAPDRRHGGGGIRQSHLLGAVADAFECHLLSTGGPADPWVAERLASTTLLTKRDPWRPRQRGLRRVRDLWVAGPGGPPEVYDAGPARRALGRAVKGMEPFDLVVVEHPGLAGLIKDRSRGRAWSLTLQNVASERAKQKLEVTVGGRQRFLARREVHQARVLERAVLRDYDLVCSASSLDASLLPGPTTVIDNGVDLAAFVPTPLPGSPRLVLTGSLGYEPNVDGVLWFVSDVWPLVRAAVPTAELALVGRVPDDRVVALNGTAGITVHADVPDVRPFLDSARVALVPLRMGSGTRLKALEAMAAGRPVAGTSVGLEGLAVRPGVEAVIADAPDALAAGIVELLSDDTAAAAATAAGRDYVEAHHDWGSIGQRYVEALGALIS